MSEKATMSKRDESMLDEVIEAVRSAGEVKEQPGTLEIGSVPDRPASALHVLFAPADAALLRLGEKDLGREIPLAYRAFLERANGMTVFERTLQLFGVRPDDKEREHPPDLVLPNVDERPSGASDQMLFFGFYNWDGSLLYLDDSDGGRVFRTARDEVDPLNEWDSVAQAIHGEFFRLAALFADGFDEDKKTVPE